LTCQESLDSFKPNSWQLNQDFKVSIPRCLNFWRGLDRESQRQFKTRHLDCQVNFNRLKNYVSSRRDILIETVQKPTSWLTSRSWQFEKQCLDRESGLRQYLYRYLKMSSMSWQFKKQCLVMSRYLDCDNSKTDISTVEKVSIVWKECLVMSRNLNWDSSKTDISTDKKVSTIWKTMSQHIEKSQSRSWWSWQLRPPSLIIIAAHPSLGLLIKKSLEH